MTDTTAADAIARIEAHRPRPYTCAACGISFAAKTSEVEPITRTLLNGKPGVYGLCPTCKADPSEAVAVAGLFDLDPDDLALEAITVPWYADLPHAMPTHPNPSRWSHLDRAAVAEQIVNARQEIEQRRGGPCYSCATTLTNPGGNWWRGHSDQMFCEGCWQMLDPLRKPLPGQRDTSVRLVASLVGGVVSVHADDLPHDFPHRVGFQAPPRGFRADRPFAYLDLLALRRRAHAYLTKIGWRWADEYSPETAGKVTW